MIGRLGECPAHNLLIGQIWRRLIEKDFCSECHDALTPAFFIEREGVVAQRWGTLCGYWKFVATR